MTTQWLASNAGDATNIRGAAYTAQTSVTRPADILAYAAGDVVGGAITFASIGPATGFINFTDAYFRVDVAAVPAGMSTFRLHLYTSTPASALVDNAAWDLTAADRAAYMGFVDFSTPALAGSTLFTQTGSLNKTIKMGATANLFGYLVTSAAFTPTSGAVKAVRINARGV